MKLRPFNREDEAAVVQLWTDCGLVVPWNDPRNDIDRKLPEHRELFLVAEDGEKIVGAVMAGYDGHRGGINYLAVHPDLQRGGLGRQLMDAAEGVLRELGCPKINLVVRTSNTEMIEFYERIGFQRDPVVCLSKRLISDD